MKNNVRNIAYTGVFSAMIFALTYFIHFPVASGYVHMGDALIYLCAGLLGSPWALIAGVIGEVFADVVSGYAVYAPATLIIKLVVSFIFTLAYKKNKDKLFSIASALMTIPAGLITIAGYFAADMIINKAYAIADIPGNVVQAVGSAVLFVVLAVAFDSVKIKKRIRM